MQFALSVMSSGCYEDDADDGEIMTLTGEFYPFCSSSQQRALHILGLGYQHAGYSKRSKYPSKRISTAE